MYFLILPAAAVGFLIGRVTKRKGQGPTSPLSGISPQAWAELVGCMAVADKGHVGRRGRLGAFQMDARRLADVGAMAKAWKGRRGSEDGVWVGEWTSGLSEAVFLGSMPLQYAVLVRSMKAMVPKVAPMVGMEIEGRVASLSGLLGVGHVAGERGVAGFVKQPEVRRRFPATVAVFEKTNKIF